MKKPKPEETVKDEPRHIERCAYCGEAVDPADSDILQIHGGENGLCHETCLRESEEQETGPEAA